MAYIICFLFLWCILVLIVPYRDFRKFYPSMIFTGLVGIVCDLYGVASRQWTYNGPTVGGLSLWSVLGIASAEGGLFIRLFPEAKNYQIKIAYWVGWALLNTIAERIFVWAGLVGYIQWNSFRAFLFYLFFFGAVWLQEYWYNGTGRLRKHE